ncbi:hypothetical protein DsansV1_C03g0033511 [Dioscorea sansibarensis]
MAFPVPKKNKGKKEGKPLVTCLYLCDRTSSCSGNRADVIIRMNYCLCSVSFPEHVLQNRGSKRKPPPVRSPGNQLPSHSLAPMKREIFCDTGSNKSMERSKTNKSH